MWVRNTSNHPDDEVRELVTEATRDLDMRRVCVNVKRLGRRRRSYGRAYREVPAESNAPRSAEHLITIALPDNVPEPIVFNSGKSDRWPHFAAHDWRELLIVVAMHEGKHIEQFREGLSISEVSCEWAGRYALARYRGQQAKAA